MKRKSSRSVSIVSMSFLDLLSCALGAVLFLDIVFSQNLRPGHATEKIPFAALTVRQSVWVDETKRNEIAHEMTIMPNNVLNNVLELSSVQDGVEVLPSQYGREERHRLG